MHALPKLLYSYDALEPFIDKETMLIHHTKHHKAYVDKLNLSLEKYPDLSKKSIEKLLTDINQIPVEIREAVVNNGGGHLNHTYYWEIMTPSAKSIIPKEGELFNAINKTFGGFDSFKEKLTDKSMALFGSGWVFLIIDNKGQISLKRHSFQNTPLSYGNKPILCVDLWEHAYYLKHQNKRNEYLNAFWNIINWRKVEENYLNA